MYVWMYFVRMLTERNRKWKREGGREEEREEEILERMSDKEEIKMCVKEQTREIRRVERKRGRGISGLELSTYTYRY